LNTWLKLNTNSLLALVQQKCCARLNQAEQSLCIILKLFALTSILTFTGATVEELASLEALSAEGFSLDPVFYGFSELLADPTFANQLILSLCSLVFILIPNKRTGLFLNKAAFAFRQNLTVHPVHDAHGCRAPPAISGCL